MRRFLTAVALLSALTAPCRSQSFISTSFSQAISSATASAFTWKQSVGTAPLQHFALQVTGTGAAASAWDVRLEGSLDGVKYAPLAQNATGDGDGSIKFSTGTTFSPVNYIRAYVNSLTLGSATKITATVLGTQ